MEPMLVECGTCAARGPGCAECVVSVLLGRPDETLGSELAADERRALDALASGGLLPPLRLAAAGLAEPEPRRPGDAGAARRASM